MISRLRSYFLSMDAAEATFSKRGFTPDRQGSALSSPTAVHSESAKQYLLEQVGKAFLEGYNQALVTRDVEALAERLVVTEPRLRGFQFEGAAMGLGIRDALSPFGGRLVQRLLSTSAGESHHYLIHVGVGWAMARLPFFAGSLRRRLDPLLSGLAIDGWGFHDGYFSPRRSFKSQDTSGRRRLAQDQARCYDQGLGRSLWFVECAVPERIDAVISMFDPPRREDLWSGVGLAAAYAGGCDTPELDELVSRSGGAQGHLRQGFLFGVEARVASGIADNGTRSIAQQVLGLSLSEVSSLAHSTLEQSRYDVAEDDTTAGYLTWRREVRRTLSQPTTGRRSA